VRDGVLYVSDTRSDQLFRKDGDVKPLSRQGDGYMAYMPDLVQSTVRINRLAR
jgi:hypothetical protein